MRLRRRRNASRFSISKVVVVVVFYECVRELSRLVAPFFQKTLFFFTRKRREKIRFQRLLWRDGKFGITYFLFGEIWRAAGCGGWSEARNREGLDSLFWGCDGGENGASTSCVTAGHPPFSPHFPLPHYLG